MRRPIVVISLALSFALAVSLVVGWAANRESTSRPMAKAQDKPGPQAQAMPEHLMYWHI
jgi:hypothetical protein